MKETLSAPTVSIIIPCYNCEQYVNETLISLQAQSYKDFEVICVNDGSKDNTVSILEKWMKNDSRIRVIHQGNGGASQARNNGLANMTGKYLLFLDSDDIYHPEYIQTLVSACEKYDADAAYCSLSRDLHFQDESNAVAEIQSRESALQNLMINMLKYGFWCYLYKSEIVKKYNLKFDENTRHGEDREFLWKYLCHCQKVVLIDKKMYGYRVNANSITQGKANWRRTERMAGLDRVAAYFKQYDCPFCEDFCAYMYPRTAWSIAKVFAVHQNHQLFERFTNEYDVKSYMKKTLKDHNRLVAFSSLLYLFHKDLFYFVLSISAKLKLFL